MDGGCLLETPERGVRGGWWEGPLYTKTTTITTTDQTGEVHQGEKRFALHLERGKLLNKTGLCLALSEYCTGAVQLIVRSL